MKHHVRQQVERILDESTGTRCSVIVQMKNEKTDITELINLAGQATQRRGMLISARDLLPPSYAEMKRKVRTSRTRKKRRRVKLRPDEKSMSSFAMELLRPVTRNLLKSEASNVLSQLTQSAFMRDVMARAADNKKKVSQFWASASAAFDINRDDLSKIVTQVPNIEAIFLNRTHKVPPVTRVEPQNLPKTITENKTSAWGIEAIGAMSIWGAYGVKGRGVKVAVLDTGIDAKHPDLAGKIRAADWAEFDRAGSQVANSKIRDSAQHGTHCCGTIAGGNDSGRWIGVAPEASLAAGMVLPNGSGSDRQILAGLQWAIDQQVDVISMSLGAYTMNQEVQDTYTQMIISANQLGIPVVVAIGNEGSQTSGSPGNDYFSFTVGATDPADLPAGFSGGRTQIISQSNFVSQRNLPLIYQKPDLVAPGVGVYSSIPGRKYDAWNGTSMATPHVAGALALLLSATDIKTRVDQPRRALLLQDLLLGSVEELGESGHDHRYGMGRLNLLKAVGIAKELGY